jgi:hypothetical protein
MSTNDQAQTSGTNVVDWDKYLEEQNKLRQEAANQFQKIMDDSPIKGMNIDPFSEMFSSKKIDLDLQKQLSAQFGLKFEDKSLGSKPKPDASQWRLKTRAIKV